MKIKKLNEAITKVINEDADSIDGIVDEVVETLKDAFDGEKVSEDTLDSYATDVIDGYFNYCDDVLDLFKELVAYEDSIYSEISDVVFGAIKSRVMDRMEDYISDDTLEESKRPVKKSFLKILKERKLNEVSDELKQRVLNKRKEQVNIAKKKLSNTVKLVKLNQPITITLKDSSVDMYKDDYQEGEDIKAEEYYYGDDITGTISNVEDLLDLIFDSVDYDYYGDLKNWGGSFNLNEYDDIFTDLFMNADHEYPSEEEIEAWKNGDEKLYAGHYIAKVEFNNSDDRTIFVNMLKKAGWDVN